MQGVHTDSWLVKGVGGGDFIEVTCPHITLESTRAPEVEAFYGFLAIALVKSGKGRGDARGIHRILVGQGWGVVIL